MIEESLHHEIVENCAYRNTFGLSSSFLEMFMLSRRCLKSFSSVVLAFDFILNCGQLTKNLGPNLGGP